MIKFDSRKNSTRSLSPAQVISSVVRNTCPPVISNVATPEYSVNGPACPVRARLAVLEKSIFGLSVPGCVIGVANVARREIGV